MRATISYQIATYSGQVDVFYDDENAEDDYLIAQAKRQLIRRAGALPFGMQAFRVLSREGADA